MKASQSEEKEKTVRPQILTMSQSEREAVRIEGGTSASSSDPRGSAETRRAEQNPEAGERSKGMPCGIRPTQDEVEEHERTHVPFRNWCKHCVFGKAKNAPHRTQDHQDSAIPCVSIDYMYMSENSNREPTESDEMPIMVMKDRWSKTVFASIVPKKGECEYAIRQAAQDLNKGLGYKKFILKGDQEPALRVLIDRIALMDK